MGESSETGTAQQALLVILCAPSGGGKTTLARHLVDTEPAVHFSVSHTTRQPRSGERDGVDYHFVDASYFDAGTRRERFAEWARVHDNFYGTSVAELSRLSNEGAAGIVFDIDVQGARQLRARYPHDSVLVYVLPPSVDTLRQRLVARKSESEAALALRMRNACEEVRHYASFDYIITNDDKSRAAADLAAIYRAERLRRVRRASVAEDFVRTLMASQV